MKSLPVFFAFLFATVQVAAQENSVTAEDYARAVKFLSWNTSKLVYNASVRPVWVNENTFCYKNRIPEGNEFILVDAKKQNRKRAFDHEKLAKALSELTKKEVDPFNIPGNMFKFSEDGRYLTLCTYNTQYKCDLKTYTCEEIKDRCTDFQRDIHVSPDGKKAAFIKDYNLWVRDLESGEENQLTTDGVENFGYATNNAGWVKSDRPVLLWSPDSKKIVTFQHDSRGVGEMYLVSTNVGHPELQAWKYPLPGDSLIFRINRVIIHVDEAKVVRLKMEPDAHRSTITDHVADWDGTLLDAEWNKDGSKFAFVSSSRDHKEAKLRIADSETGEVKDIMGEKVETFFESGYDKVNWHVLNETEEVIWYSQRSDWGHLYLYDLNTGKFKKQITSGNWNVLQVLRIDEENQKIYFIGCGREEGDPYFHYLYSVNIDGSNLKLLTPEQANHSISFSPEGNYFVDIYSTPVEPPVALLRNDEGSELLTLEKADISELVEAGWQPPVPIKVKGRDGETDIYGLMYKPTNFDPAKKYPVLNYLYPGPQSGSVGSRSFRASRSDKQAVAELGFIVVEVDAMGTPQRSKSFHEFYYGNMGDNGIPDQMAAIKELAGRYSWIDINRVGIWGGSGGGFASTRAILEYPDFYKVAVSNSGNHDNRNYEDDWGEKWHGMLVTHPDGTTNYDNQANQLLAKNLKGKLLLAHGTLDSNVPPYNTLLVVDALIKANKDFDLIMFPNRGHGLGIYLMRRRWDYFVKHLLGVEPPKEYDIYPSR